MFFWVIVWVISCSGNNGLISCSDSSNGRGPSGGDGDDFQNVDVKGVERLVEEKRRAELSTRISSGEFTVDKARYVSEFVPVLYLEAERLA